MAGYLIFALLFLIPAVAFGLVARRCRTGERPVSNTAWLTCAAMLTVALLQVVWPLLGSRLVYSLTALTFFALVAFGVTSHRPFGSSWSIPASTAGLLGVFGYIGHAYYFFGGIFTGVWLIPLLILGIAMCRTRVGPRAIN
jgi:hypothetical protein